MLLLSLLKQCVAFRCQWHLEDDIQLAECEGFWSELLAFWFLMCKWTEMNWEVEIDFTTNDFGGCSPAGAKLGRADGNFEKAYPRSRKIFLAEGTISSVNRTNRYIRTACKCHIRPI